MRRMLKKLCLTFAVIFLALVLFTIISTIQTINNPTESIGIIGGPGVSTYTFMFFFIIRNTPILRVSIIFSIIGFVISGLLFLIKIKNKKLFRRF